MEQDQATNGRANSANSNLQRGRVLSPGTAAPDFCLKSTPDQSVGLSDFKGQPLVGIDELAIFNEALPEIHRYGAALLAISVDNIWSHLAFTKNNNFRFPLLSDFEPKGAVARAYGAYQDHDGLCGRAQYLIDENGSVAWSHLPPIGVNPGVDGVLDALDAHAAKNKQQGVA